MILPSKVVFADEKLKNEFEKLDETDVLHKWIKRAIEDLKQNCFCGIQIPKKLIPAEYLQKYEIDNLWKYNLPDAWRLLYSVAQGEVIVIAILIEWLDHKDYEKRFGYK